MTWREYHEATKHTVESLRQTPHILDWQNMPDPFRHYEGVPLLDLPADPPVPETPALEVLFGLSGSSPAADGATFLSQLLFYSAAISASKRVPSTGYRYALRVNPSSGNLHPTEFHFLTRSLKDWPDGLYHYRPSAHMAEQRALGDLRMQWIGNSSPAAFVLTSIVSRESWKYRDRAYRYCLHDDEWPMLIVELRGRTIPVHESSAPAPLWYGGHANQVSAKPVVYPRIDGIHAATKRSSSAPGGISAAAAAPTGRGDISLPRSASSKRSFGEVARMRRSALDFVGGMQTMSLAQLSAALGAVDRPLCADFAGARFVQLYLYAHRVHGLEPGIYRWWPESAELEQIRSGDQRVQASALSLGQDLAGNACVAFSMIADIERAVHAHGDRGYRYVHFEAGAIGQRLYLAAEALGLGATGIGAFYDDRVHTYLNLAPAQGQVVYHFAIGYPVPDPRLQA